jgi:sugar O-acyltransferase (sialic acid O-acetyltransferase NeuD family)
VLDKQSVIIGYSGHAYVVAESFMSMNNSLIYYSDKKKTSFNPFNLEYLGFESDINFRGWDMNLSYILGIGDNFLREKIAKFIASKAKEIETIIDSHSKVSKNANIGSGVFISKGVLVNAFSEIGDFVILNTGCIIEHECVIGSAAHIAPGAILAGNVKVGKRSFIGANAVIKQGVEIGDDVVIGAGSVILNNVDDNSRMVGNPGKKIL